MTLDEITPLHDRLLIRPLHTPVYKSRGHIVPETVTDWIPPTQGEVLKRGPLARKVRPGSRVLYGLGSGVRVTLEDNSEVLLLRERDVICEMD